MNIFSNDKRNLILTTLAALGFVIIYPFIRTKIGLLINLIGGIPVLLFALNYGIRFGLLSGLFFSAYMTVIRLITNDPSLNLEYSLLIAMMAGGMGGAVGLVSDKVKELQKAEASLENKITQLENLTQELESFSYSLSHDLRAPLRALSGLSSIVLENNKEKLDDESIHYLNRIEDAANKMDGMINGLLDLSRISRKNIQSDLVNLSALAKEIIGDLTPRELNQEIIFNITDGISVQGDERLLRVLLLNLIDNAWKYSRDCNKVLIEFSSINENGQQIFFVRDKGIGFDSSYTQTIFSPFQRLHSESEFEGYGIGLTTCRKIVQQHGGKIWAESEVGKGATFFFTLPNTNNQKVL